MRDVMDKNTTIVTTATAAKVGFTSVLGAISWVLTYAGINKEVFAIFAVLVVIDFITGIGKAYILKQSITSNKAKYGVLSKFSLIFLPVVMALAAKGVGANATTFFTWGMNLLIMSELYSIIGNIYSIRNGKELPEWDVVALLGRKIREKFEGDKEV